MLRWVFASFSFSKFSPFEILRCTTTIPQIPNCGVETVGVLVPVADAVVVAFDSKSPENQTMLAVLDSDQTTFRGFCVAFG